ncbi:MAG: hypothetical protein NC221_02540 [Duncaniella sp.]|nr:hypothetical protein [Duncaniella sp.]
MKHIRSIYSFPPVLLICILCAFFSGCTDDTFDDLKYGVEYPDGTTTVDLNIDFAPLASAKLNSRTAPAGNVIRDLKDFSILFFDTRQKNEEGLAKLTYIKHFSSDDKGVKYNISDATRKPGDASNGLPLAETSTKHVDLELEGVPYSSYIIYAVANLGGSAKSTEQVLTEKNITEGSSIEDFKLIKVDWDKSDMLNNAQMTGFFSVGEQSKSPGTGSEPTEVEIRTPRPTIHSWLRRMVSKVTIDYDATALRNGVTVTIRKVTIRDIAASAYLGVPNRIGGDDTEGNLINKDGLINGANEGDNNHCIDYIDEEHPNGIVLTSATADYPKSKDFEGEPHRESDPALFFFENMQGEVPDKDNNGKLQDGKLQDQDGDGKIDYPGANDPNHDDYVDYKDGLKYGTYVEVEADYQANAVGHIGKGSIKYRFMIGKNVTTNCDAERNHHYKLKLCFLGNANEVDWHVDYDEEPGFYGPNPYFVSYGYNRMTYYPIKISGKVVGKVKLTIMQNAWWPNNAKDYNYMLKTEYGPDGITKLINDEGQDSVGINYFSAWKGVIKMYHPSASQNKLEPWTGFLSLSQPMNNNNTAVFSLAEHKVNLKDDGPNYDLLYRYWIGELADDNGYKYPRGVREYETTVGPHGDNATGTYTVTKDENSTTINVPFFTREKQLQKSSAYTGANPFSGYPREAKIKLEYTLDVDGVQKEMTDIIKVYQVRRLGNPSGIWRNYNNATPFHVVLKQLDTETSTTFSDVKSIGPWRAYISRGNTDFITLDGKTEVRGGDGTNIDFNITFRGKISRNENNCAIIRVEYHNYSCHHLIFVRQGSAPIQLRTDAKIKWHLANVVRSTNDDKNNPIVEEGVSPLDEGSLFRYGNLVQGIPPLCNDMYDAEKNGIPFTPDMFDDGNKNPTFSRLSNGDTNEPWNNISCESKEGAFPSVIKISGRNGNYRLPTTAEFSMLCPTSGKVDEVMENDYGVLYGDDATRTADNVKDAYGYFRDNTLSDYENKPNTDCRGMRGLFIYNNTTTVATLGGNHIFLPIGRSGFGRRKHGGKNDTKSAHNGTYRAGVGVHQYAGRFDWYEDKNSKLLPLFYDIFRSRGALYWPQKKNGNDWTLDINYKTYDFSLSDLGYTEAYSDACFVRLVEDM